MFKRSLNRGFAFIDLLVVISMIGILIALLLPSLGTAREEAQRNRCQLKIKMIGLVLLNHESAYIRFPLVYNAPNNLFDGKTPQALVATPAGTGSGAIPGKMTGWSWIVPFCPTWKRATSTRRSTSIPANSASIRLAATRPAMRLADHSTRPSSMALTRINIALASR